MKDKEIIYIAKLIENKILEFCTEDVKTIKDLGKFWNQWNFQNQLSSGIPYLLLVTKYNQNTLEWSFTTKKSTTKDFSLFLALSNTPNPHMWLRIYKRDKPGLGTKIYESKKELDPYFLGTF